MHPPPQPKASGIGLAVVDTLVAQGGWQVHIVDLNNPREGALPENTYFHRADLRDYASLGAAFKDAFLAGGRRLDFVFANAGIIEQVPLYDGNKSASVSGDEEIELPPRPNYMAVEVNLLGAIDTVHIARHFMLRSAATAGAKERGAIVVTGSCASVWPAYWSPVYTASKFGILGFTRAIAGQFKLVDGIRVNALLPGAVNTPIIEWGDYPAHMFTPKALLADVVLALARGGEIVDSKGTRVPANKAYGQAVVVTGEKFYVHPESEYCDEVMAETVGSTKMENRFKDGGV
ncbi:unnamed protein product [Discula destructiva]